MATDLHDDLPKKLKKATAILALAADRGVVRGSCLTSEEMAALVEGRSRGTALPAIWEHLSTCDSCYAEWVLLKKSVPPGAVRGRLYHLRRLTNLRYLGTALAVAATIAVYVQVIKTGDKAVEQAVVPQIGTLQDKNLAVPPQGLSVEKATKGESAQVMEQAPVVAPAAPPAVSAPLGNGAAKGKLSVQSAPKESMKNVQEERQKPAAAPMPATRKMARGIATDAASSRVEGAAAPQSAVPAPENTAAWLEQLRAACQSGRDDTPFWQNMAAMGVRLQTAQAEKSSGATEAKMATILSMVQAIKGPDTVSQQCRMILAELARP